MKRFSTLIVFFVLAYTVQGQITTTNTQYLGDLQQLEKEYLDNEEDPKGVDILKNYNLKYEALKEIYASNGLTLDLGNIDKKQLKSNPALKTAFKNYRKALKIKINYFKSKEDFKDIIKRTYPGLSKD